MSLRLNHRFDVHLIATGKPPRGMYQNLVTNGIPLRIKRLQHPQRPFVPMM
jgi:hypothetical protein